MKSRWWKLGIVVAAVMVLILVFWLGKWRGGKTKFGVEEYPRVYVSLQHFFYFRDTGTTVLTTASMRREILREHFRKIISPEVEAEIDKFVKFSGLIYDEGYTFFVRQYPGDPGYMVYARKEYPSGYTLIRHFYFRNIEPFGPMWRVAAIGPRRPRPED